MRPAAGVHRPAQHRGQHLARAHAGLGRQPQRPHRPLPHRGWVLASAGAGGWLKAPTSAFTFKTLLRHYAKRELTPQLVDMKLGHRWKGHKGRAGWLS